MSSQEVEQHHQEDLENQEEEEQLDEETTKKLKNLKIDENLFSQEKKENTKKEKGKSGKVNIISKLSEIKK
jgi:hypothetical protein